MNVGKQLASAVTVRLGIAAGGVLGGLGVYWIGPMTTLADEMRPWMAGAGAVAGFAAAWAVLAWLARRHLGAGVIAGAVLTVAAAAALIARFAS
jgi:hypothetical protein